MKTKKPSKAKQLEQRVAQLEAALSPEMQRKIADSHNIVGDVMAFNDRLAEIRESVKPQQELQEMHNQCVKMVRRINKTHGDLFKHRAEQLAFNDKFKTSHNNLAEQFQGAVKSINNNFSKQGAGLAELRNNPYLRLGSVLIKCAPYIGMALIGIALYKLVYHG